MRKFKRERLIIDFLNRGVSVAEIAERIDMTEKRMRALVREILARRMAASPEDFAALQVSRLNEALLAAYGAMSAATMGSTLWRGEGDPSLPSQAIEPAIVRS